MTIPDLWLGVALIAATFALLEARDVLAESITEKADIRRDADYWLAKYNGTRVPTSVRSTVAEVNGLREWRQRRALSGRDHLVKHSVEAFSDSDAAREILIFCVGQSECGE